ncbi:MULTISPECIES: hypothetical protein [unclassified Mesorhizobium]|uniref:hypothetical protein n=1 Tax=unclassified Mesorhizobium TaxID=325217 RepID=UPI000F75D7E2|nr:MULTISPECIES: hypothetical protein [unclassified Mesorhizobium]RUW84019.1 hypothetical protein EOA29_11030 [Mesorhizobium sp. M1E.F.Ca.ET.063.01.1.1]AZO23891.1 hypothetical protein EJ070_26555 [Mesorhizobium sp. M1E.F.Ca.ET.045.02.1.1]RWD95209.1 MAG: hypothetical protein EOS39_03880 [Mesorhizobium sp.]TIU35033.1 MAG: hypothetical protein E5W38_03495 [Mesorhizobium sp.]TIV53061.1 MAG: hypothetical protein E5V88_10345 [Mesorhizobium sp.]
MAEAQSAPLPIQKNSEQTLCSYSKMKPLRRRIERTIEALLTILDEADGEPDLEATADDEPYLAGWSGTNEDLEEENEHGGDILDEPHDGDERELYGAEFGALGYLEGGQSL